MNIPALGEATLKALTSTWSSPLRQGNSGLDGLDGDSVSLSPAGALALRGQGPDAFRADFEKLGELIESGDLAGAKALFETMQERLQSRPGGDRGPATIKDGFQALASALESGDAAAANTAWSSLSRILQDFAPGAGGGNPLKKDLEKLSGLLDSGDTDAARDLLKDILEKLKRSPRGLPAALESGLSALSTALESGDLGAARTALDTVQSGLTSTAARAERQRGTNAGSELDMLLLIASWKAQGLPSGGGPDAGGALT